MVPLRGRIPLRRAIYQIHLWTGLALGLYVLMLSVTGSALVYRLELNRLFEVTAPRFDSDRAPLTPDALADAARRAYPGYAVIDVGTRINRHRPVVEVRLARGDDRLERLFDPYTGADLGDAMSRVMRILTWLALLHDDLLLGETGRLFNGIGSGLVGLLVITGPLVWWPGWASRRRASGPVDRRSLNIRFHRSVGMWSLGLMLVWVTSGLYLAFPEPFDAAAFALSEDDLSGIGYQALTWLTYLHFGRFSAAAQIVWLAVGLVPAVLVVTGVGMWWARRSRGLAPRQAAPARVEQTPSTWRRNANWTAIGVVGCCVWAMYSWANYREERHVRRFLDAVAAGGYREAHAMWADEAYGFERFLADWGARGRHTAGGAPAEVIDSTTYGAVVTVYVRTGGRIPVALEVDKETMLLSYAPTNEYAPRAPVP